MAPMKRSAEDPAGQMVLVPQKKQRNEMMIVNNASRCQARMIEGLICLSENCRGEQKEIKSNPILMGLKWAHIFAGQ